MKGRTEFPEKFRISLYFLLLFGTIIEVIEALSDGEKGR